MYLFEKYQAMLESFLNGSQGVLKMNLPMTLGVFDSNKYFKKFLTDQGAFVIQENSWGPKLIIDVSFNDFGVKINDHIDQVMVLNGVDNVEIESNSEGIFLRIHNENEVGSLLFEGEVDVRSLM